MRLGVRVGKECWRLHAEKMQNIQSSRVEIDEIWGLIGKKKANTKAWDFQGGLGDVWTFTALDADSKLIPAFHVGQRTMIHADCFLKTLAKRLHNRVQLSSDGLAAYRESVEKSFD